ncbi:MAG TPA: M28 family peptidase [Flavisolibacter sp.]
MAVLSQDLHAQHPSDSIRRDDIEPALRFLASDNMQGRGNYTKELLAAGHFIADTFDSLRLKTFPLYEDYFHAFNFSRPGEPYIDSIGRFDVAAALFNVIGVLEGNSRPNEIVIFSAHYDHVGVEKGSIHNGANDNASGTAALLALARYFAQRGDNERTLIFCAFAGEELGLLGSEAFAHLVKPEHIVAVVNLEMLGVYRKKNSIVIAGEDLSDFGAIVRKNIRGTGTEVLKEAAFNPTIFSRSDNYPFAKRGIPAHTILADDDSYPCYHKPCDDLKIIDIDNMVLLVRAIARATETIVSGADTPSRIVLKKKR